MGTSLPLAAASVLPAVTPVSSGSEAAAASVLMLWLGLFGLFGLLLFWALPVAVAGLLATGRQQPPTPGVPGALLGAALLGWIGVAIFLYRGAEKRCPHCHTRIVAETTRCYWCGGETQPTPLPAFLRLEDGGIGRERH